MPHAVELSTSSAVIVNQMTMNSSQKLYLSYSNKEYVSVSVGPAISVTHTVELTSAVDLDVQMTMNSSKNPYISNTEEESASVGDNVGKGTHGANSDTYTLIFYKLKIFCYIAQSCNLMT